MLTYNNILNEIKDVPIDKLEELHSFIHTLTTKEKKSDSLRKKILSFSNAFNDMKDTDFEDFSKKTKEIRISLFDRKINI